MSNDTELITGDAIQALVDSIQAETDIGKTQDLIALFNWNLSKKNVARLLKLNNLYDNITDQMEARVLKRPDQFSNDDLLNYLKTLQNAIDGSNKQLQSIEEPPPTIIQNNTQINVTVGDEFSRESRDRILRAIQATMAAADSAVEVDYEDKTNIQSEDTSNG